MKPKVDEATKRRIRGGRMLLAGKKPSEVAWAVGVSRQTAYSWKAVIEGGGGIEALRDLSRGGRPASLSEQDKQWLTQALIDGPTAHGFGTELWTLSSGCASSSRSASVCASAKCMSGGCWANWGFPTRSPTSVPWSATSRPSSAGGEAAGLRLKKKPGARAA